jgi:MFS superfamily sulfate permease-like transporter
MSASPAVDKAKTGWAFFPPTAWLREYKPRWLLSDAVAGLTLAAYAVPVSMAYAGLAGLPPVSGIYCYLFAGLGFFLLGTSRHLAVGPTSAIAILAASFLPLAANGVKLTGEVPAGLPSLAVPDVGLQELRALVPLAFACFLLMYVESIAAGRTFALKHKYRLDPRQELLGLGLANASACFGQGFVVAGGLSQSAVNEKAGAKTPLALPMASLALVAVLLCLTAPLALLPQAILGAIVLMAVKDLIKVKEFRHLWRVSRFDFAVAMTALAGVLMLGILQGVLLAMLASLLMLLRRASRPHVAFLGRIPGTTRFSDLTIHPDNERVPELLVFRVEAALLYMNAEYVTQTVLDRVDTEEPPVRLAIWDLSSTPNLDVPAARAIKQIGGQLKDRGVELRLVEARAQLRDLLRAEGIEESSGRISRLDSLSGLVEEFERGLPPKGY